MIYLISPYSHPDAAVMEDRYDRACRIAGAMLARGEMVYSPVAHCHPIAVRCGLPRGWDFWGPHCVQMLDCASRVVVAKLNGWRQSRGVAADIIRARYLGLHISFDQPDFLLRPTVDFAWNQERNHSATRLQRLKNRAPESLPG